MPESLSEGDLALLQTIVALTQEAGGRPPTLAEITVALGLQSSSRGNIQRQLTHLRPQYVDWTTSPRSLHVTDVGLALLTHTPSTSLATLPLSEVVLSLIASGLTRMTNEVSAGAPLRVPYPNAWQRGMNILASECLQRGVMPPSHSTALVEWCHQPPKQWPITFALAPRLLDSPLLNETDQPTELCRELAYTGDAEAELYAQYMGRVRSTAETYHLQETYVAFRSFVITNPIVTAATLHTQSFAFGRLGEELHQMYDRVPTTVYDHGLVQVCGFCGWTLERRNGQWHCGDERCRELTANFTRNVQTLPASSDLMRVLRPIRRYVVAPGKYELRTARSLQQLHITVELWPGFDAYDLRVVFSDGTTWGIDIKDWRYPHLLAPKLVPLEMPPGCDYQRAIYAIPDERLKENPSYLAFLRGATTNPAQAHRFDILSLRELIEEARSYKEGLHV